MPHLSPRTQAAPEVATVGDAELHFALVWVPCRSWSVIGTLSLYPGTGFQP